MSLCDVLDVDQAICVDASTLDGGIEPQDLDRKPSPSLSPLDPAFSWETHNSQGCFLAQALFDNDAESPEELPFHRGDVLRVVTQDLQGLQGWWLCSLHGMQGIAPANRLQLLPSGVLPVPAHSLAADSSDYQQPVPSWMASCMAPPMSAFPAHFENSSSPPQTLFPWTSYYHHRKPGIVQGLRPPHLHPTNNSIYEVPTPVCAMANVLFSPMANSLDETDYDIPKVKNASSYCNFQPTSSAWKTESDYDIPVTNNRRIQINALSSSCANPTSVKGFGVSETYPRGSKDGELPKANMPREKETISMQGRMKGASLRSQSSSDSSLHSSCGSFEPYKIHSDEDERPSKVHNYVDEKRSRPRGYMDEKLLEPCSHTGEKSPGPQNCNSDGDVRPSKVHNNVDEKRSRPRGYMDEKLLEPCSHTGEKSPGPLNCRGEKPSGSHCQRIEKSHWYIGHKDEKPPGLLGCREKVEDLRDPRYHVDEDSLDSQDCKDSDYDTPPQVTRDLACANTHLGKSRTSLQHSVTPMPESHAPYPSELPSTCNKLLVHQPLRTPRLHWKMDSCADFKSSPQAECAKGLQDLKLQEQQEYKGEQRQQNKGGKIWEGAMHLNMLEFYTEQCCGQHALLQSAAAAVNRACEPSAGPPDTQQLLQLARTLLLAGHGVLFVGDAACRFAVTPNLHDTLLGATRALFGALRNVAARAREAPARLRVRDPDALSRLTSSISELAQRTRVLLHVLDEAGNTTLLEPTGDRVIMNSGYDS
uniref:SH3 domain-containing protein n=2 Tax=Eptatretus burgeri TaxID=7764 RepID=A0A8C4QDQ9_EPTBU